MSESKGYLEVTLKLSLTLHPFIWGVTDPSYFSMMVRHWNSAMSAALNCGRSAYNCSGLQSPCMRDVVGRMPILQFRFTNKNVIITISTWLHDLFQHFDMQLDWFLDTEIKWITIMICWNAPFSSLWRVSTDSIMFRQLFELLRIWSHKYDAMDGRLKRL